MYIRISRERELKASGTRVDSFRVSDKNLNEADRLRGCRNKAISKDHAERHEGKKPVRIREFKPREKLRERKSFFPRVFEKMRYYAVIPSGEGKTTLAREHPELFLDIDDVVERTAENFGGKKPTAENRETFDFSKWDSYQSNLLNRLTDTRIVLVHGYQVITGSVDLKEKPNWSSVGTYILRYGTGIRFNEWNRASIKTHDTNVVEYENFLYRNDALMRTIRSRALDRSTVRSGVVRPDFSQAGDIYRAGTGCCECSLYTVTDFTGQLLLTFLEYAEKNFGNAKEKGSLWRNHTEKDRASWSYVCNSKQATMLSMLGRMEGPDWKTTRKIWSAHKTLNGNREWLVVHGDVHYSTQVPEFSGIIIFILIYCPEFRVVADLFSVKTGPVVFTCDLTHCSSCIANDYSKDCRSQNHWNFLDRRVLEGLETSRFENRLSNRDYTTKVFVRMTNKLAPVKHGVKAFTDIPMNLLKRRIGTTGYVFNCWLRANLWANSLDITDLVKNHPNMRHMYETRQYMGIRSVMNNEEEYMVFSKTFERAR